MFQWANTFNQTIGNWNTTKVTDMYSMFLKADAFNQDINTKEVNVNGATYVAWDTSSVTTMGYMFWKVVTFDQNIRGWNVGNVTDYDSFDTETNETWTDDEKPCWGFEECPSPTPTPAT
jgi:surface protein